MTCVLQSEAIGFHLAGHTLPAVLMPLHYPSAQGIVPIASQTGPSVTNFLGLPGRPQPGTGMFLSGKSASALHNLFLSLPTGSNHGSVPPSAHWLVWARHHLSTTSK